MTAQRICDAIPAEDPGGHRQRRSSAVPGRSARTPHAAGQRLGDATHEGGRRLPSNGNRAGLSTRSVILGHALLGYGLQEFLCRMSRAALTTTRALRQHRRHRRVRQQARVRRSPVSATRVPGATRSPSSPGRIPARAGPPAHSTRPTRLGSSATSALDGDAAVQTRGCDPSNRARSFGR